MLQMSVYRKGNYYCFGHGAHWCATHLGMVRWNVNALHFIYALSHILVLFQTLPSKYQLVNIIIVSMLVLALISNVLLAHCYLLFHKSLT